MSSQILWKKTTPFLSRVTVFKTNFYIFFSLSIFFIVFRKEEKKDEAVNIVAYIRSYILLPTDDDVSHLFFHYVLFGKLYLCKIAANSILIHDDRFLFYCLCFQKPFVTVKKLFFSWNLNKNGNKQAKKEEDLFIYCNALILDLNVNTFFICFFKKFLTCNQFLLYNF